jgi:protein-disulfide isomerase
MNCAVIPSALLICSAVIYGARPEMVEGNRASSVKVIIYEDLQCSDCLTFRTLMDEKLLSRYGSCVAFLHRDMPLPKHEWARPAAIAGRWVYEKNAALGIVFRRELMAEQSHITLSSLKFWLREFARRNKLDESAIVESLTDARLVILIDQDYMAAVARGVSKTPSVFVGGQPFTEIIIYEDLARALDIELGK